MTTDKQQAATPRTDEAAYDWHPDDGITRRPDGEFVKAKFCRTLERALTECTEQLAAERVAHNDWLKSYQSKVTTLQAEVARLKGLVAARDARIDALMLEFCPSEMSKEQVANWMKHQRVVPESEGPIEIDKEKP